MLIHKPALFIYTCFEMIFLVLCLIFLIPASGEAEASPYLWGTDAGLYSRDTAGRVDIHWTGGKVKKILPLKSGEPLSGRNAAPSGWAVLTDDGILVSADLKNWERRNSGLPEKVIKIYENGEKSFITTVQEIKDFEVDPANSEIMVCAVKDTVYLSENGGRDWQDLGMPNFRTNGIKAVAVSSAPGLTVFCSHSVYGVYSLNPLERGAKWIDISGGLEKLETTGNPDEVSDIRVRYSRLGTLELYAGQSFRPRLYRLDWGRMSWETLWSGGDTFGALDSVAATENSLVFVRDGGIAELTPGAETVPAWNFRPRENLAEIIRAIPGNNRPNCAVLRLDGENSGPGASSNAQDGFLSLSELWLLDENFQGSGNKGPGLAGPAGQHGAPSSGAGRPAGNGLAPASGLEGLYLPVNHAMDSGSLAPYLDIIEERNLNMLVIDMKDDYGRLRFTPQNPSMKNLGRVFWPVDIDSFLKTMKERGIYTVARIVVFKDPEAAKRDGGKYAVWDASGATPWRGYYDVRRKKTPEPPEPNPVLTTEILPAGDPEYEIVRTWYDESWVDPYSEEIWDYNAQVAEELIRRGFDEIQFDYIRFPTDGINLGDARFRWREAGMDMDSAILSFLRHVRSRVKAPISVDIYGANGWYRTGARTGQEVELLSPWVDVICPMYYPSHFEQDFLAQNPPEERPFRIYHQGTLRTRIIARGRVIVRPWAQAFYLNVSYDRKYYNTDYVRRQTEGVRAAGSGGLCYWNNSGRYEDIPGF